MGSDYFIELLEAWKEDPILFIADFFNETPDKKQADVLRALPHANKIAVRSGHGVGKTWLASRAAIWYFVTHPYSKVITTAPTWQQLRKILWSEIHSAMREVPDVFKANFEILDMDIYMRDANGNRLADWFITGRSSDKPDNMQGFHAPYLFYIVDEASGVKEEIYEAIEGSQTTNAKMLLIGNPIRPEGYFYNAFHKNRELWTTFHISCYDSPRVSKKWIEERKKEWGENSPVFKARVLGEFPDMVENALIPLAWVERAIQNNFEFKPADEDVKIRIGVDVARHGQDETVITVIGQKGDLVKVFEIVAAQGKDTTWTARRAKRLFDAYQADVVNVDDTGVGGGVTDLLKEEGVKANPIKFGANPTNDNAKLIFANLKAQIYYELRDYFDPAKEGAIDIPDNAKLIRDLTGLKQDYTSRDKIQIIDPPKSPDYSDSLAMAVTTAGVKKVLKPPSIFLR